MALIVFGLVMNGLITGLITWGVLKSEMRYWRRAINAAHARLDKMGAPPAGGDWLPES